MYICICKDPLAYIYIYVSCFSGVKIKIFAGGLGPVKLPALYIYIYTHADYIELKVACADLLE